MSRIGKKPISIPSGVEVKIEGNNFKAKGPLGELSLDFKDVIGNDAGWSSGSSLGS